MENFCKDDNNDLGVTVKDGVLFHVFFLKPKTESAISERLLSWAILKHQQHFGYETNIQHIVVALGNTCYELTMGGVVSYPLTLDLMTSDRVIACYITKLEYDKAEVAKRVLVRQVNNGYKLDLVACFKYWLSYKINRLLYVVDNTEPSESIKYTKVNKSVLYFNLPYTCVTLANLVLEILGFNGSGIVEYDDHLPAPLFILLSVLAEYGEGILWMSL